MLVQIQVKPPCAPAPWQNLSVATIDADRKVSRISPFTALTVLNLERSNFVGIVKVSLFKTSSRHGRRNFSKSERYLVILLRSKIEEDCLCRRILMLFVRCSNI